MNITETALTIHLGMPAGYLGDAFLADVSRKLHDQFGIEQVTIQIETGVPSQPCALAP